MLVSVVIAAYNVEAHVSRAIESVQAQTFQNFEILVVDDASSDRTSDIVAEYARKDPRIRLFRQAKNGGPALARNIGLDRARGEWIAILDADDAWRPERLEKMLAAALSTGSDFVADNQIFFDAALQREVGIAHELSIDMTEVTAERLFSSPNAMRLGEMKPLIRRGFIAGCGLRYNPMLRFGEDFVFYAELLIKGARAVLLADAYYIYTTPVGFVSKQRSAGSRTANPALNILADGARGLISKYDINLPPDLKCAMLRFSKDMQTRFAFRHITKLRKENRPLALLSFMATHPRATTGYIRASRTYKSLIGLFAWTGFFA